MRLRGPLRAAALWLPLALLAGGCGSSRVSLTGEVRYGKTAEEDYVAGQDELRSENWVEAQKFFEHCRTKYPFSKYAPLAELRLADIKLLQDRWIEAADAYGSFVKMHPTHDQVDYAAFREGLALVKDGPSDFFAFPPPQERELKTTRDGVARLEAFLAKYPGSPHAAEARALLASSREVLVEHEWYAAEFYAKRKLWAGAAGRWETLVKSYPGSSREVAALFRLSDAYVELEDRYRARQALQQIIVRHPDDPQRPRAEQRLAELR